MSSVYAFRCRTPEHPQAISTLVVFCGPTAFSINDLAAAIKSETSRALSPDAAYLIYPKDRAAEVRSQLEEDNSAFHTLSVDTSIGLYSYDEAGVVRRHAVLRGAPPEALPLQHIRRQGLTELFNRRQGLLEAGPTAHFVKPSKKTDSRFLRASHALSEGAEIFFVAFWLLPYLTDDLDFVHLDTSSIASVVLAGLLIKRLTRMPTVRTFQSYRGIYTHPFSPDRADLVLISASQSGSMAGLIASRVKDAERVVTLFSMGGDPPKPTQVLCDLRIDEKLNPTGYPPAPPPPDPALTRPIRLIGEHFIAAPEPARTVVPGLKHAPTVIAEKISRLQGQGIFVAYKADAERSSRRAIWIDVEQLRQTEPFKEWVEKTVIREIPASVRAIVYPDKDTSAKSVADALIEAIRRHGGDLKNVTLLGLSEIEQDKTAGWPVSGSPIVIVGGATGHGEKLLSISRALRRYAPASHRIFLSAATIPSSKRAFGLLQSNLRQPSHCFSSMFEVFLDRATASESWDKERDYLAELDQTLPNTVASRLQLLDNSPSGLRNDLFLPGAKEGLKLRDNFAFWPVGTPCGAASQADVFLTMAAILQNLRTGADVLPEHRIVNDPQTHTVLSGETFARYNDGVIQAAILRAALPIELNYRDTPEESRLVGDLIRQMVDLSDRQQGEALGEFLLAILLDRMSLADADLETLKDTLRASLDRLNEQQRWIAEELLPG
ncbi:MULTISPECIES: hypothetical protein [Roseomonadaceae]|uniref:Uncharacterized protein n=1 Tax=Falsiroseomonas oleicola TaxID=2801474 RepID=A0ABS6HBP3_9PROT|nr:hypothetical protein [Roseomonas oleicola]MBU8546124.1 hypothetical protein [Roseomonas oleicola]